MDSSIVAIVVGCLASLIGGLVLWNLRVLREEVHQFSLRMEKQETKVEKLEQRFVGCRTDADREFATKEEYVRSESYTRMKLDQVLASQARMEGSSKIIEQIPSIVGNVTREIVKELQNGGLN